jgi:hypothetical protein
MSKTRPPFFDKPVTKISKSSVEKSKKVIELHTYGSVDALFFAYGGHAEGGPLRHRMSATYVDGRTRRAAVGGYVTIRVQSALLVQVFVITD